MQVDAAYKPTKTGTRTLTHLCQVNERIPKGVDPVIRNKRRVTGKDVNLSDVFG